MSLSQQEYCAIIANESKRIEGDVTWEYSQNPRAREFRIDIESDEGYPLFLKG